MSKEVTITSDNMVRVVFGYPGHKELTPLEAEALAKRIADAAHKARSQTQRSGKRKKLGDY